MSSTSWTRKKARKWPVRHREDLNLPRSLFMYPEDRRKAERRWADRKVAKKAMMPVFSPIIIVAAAVVIGAITGATAGGIAGVTATKPSKPQIRSVDDDLGFLLSLKSGQIQTE